MTHDRIDWPRARGRHATGLAAILAVLGAGGAAEAGDSAPKLTARLESSAVRVDACVGGTCQSATFDLPPEVTSPRVASLDLTGRRPALLVEAGLREGPGRFVVLIAADAEGAPVEVLRGSLDRPKGVEGSRQTRVLVREREGDGESIAFGTQFEALDACGRPVLTHIKKLNPMTLDWASVPNRILHPEGRPAPSRLFARRTDVSLAELPRVLVSKAASSALDGTHSGLTDGTLERGWAENSAGGGPGELVVMSASADVAIEGFQLIPRGLDGASDRAAPRRVLLVTDHETFDVTMPEDAATRPAGTVYDVMLPAPIRTECVALVLDTAYDADRDAVGLAELRATTPLDRVGGLPAIVSQLDRGGTEGRAASAVLRRSGPRAIAATLTGFDALGLAGRARALEVLDGGVCSDIAPFFVQKLVGRGRPTRWDPDGDDSLDAMRERVRRCRSESRAALAEIVERGGDDRERGLAARELASLAPELAVPAIADAIDDASVKLRARLRDALAATSRDRRAHAALEAVLTGPTFEARPPLVRVELLRALGSTLPTRAGATAAFASTLTSDASFRTRYLLLGPAGHLARSGDAFAARFLVEALSRDPDPRIRAAAAREAHELASAAAPLAAALGDGSPRVREAALEALATASRPGTSDAIAPLLERDPWTFVRVAAAAALGAVSGSEPGLRGLLRGLEDRSALVRLAALRALGRGIATVGVAPAAAREASDRVHALADDPRLSTELRSAAITAVGRMCRFDSAELLYKLALRTGVPELGYDRELGMAALGALSSLRPGDRAARLEPLLRDSRTPDDVRSVTREVIGRAGRCGE
jgi:HEAT repeat protein